MKSITIENISKYKNIIVFGAKQNSITEFLIHEGCNIVKFIDNDSRKWGDYIYNCPIYDVESLRNENMDDLYVVVVIERDLDAVCRQLNIIGCKNYCLAYKELEDLSGVRYQAFHENVNLDTIVIDTLHIELSGYCNCKCVYCPFHGISGLKKEKAFMKWNTLKRIIENVKKINTIATLNIVGAGEVFLNKEWYEMTNYVIEQLGIRKLVMYTNGMLLTKTNIEKINKLDVESIDLEISVDGETEDENDLYRVNSLYKVIKENIAQAYKVLGKNKRINLMITNCYPLTYEDCCSNGKPIPPQIPEFIKRDFHSINMASKYTMGLKEFVIPGLKLVKFEWDKTEAVCLDIFHILSVDANGKMMRCSCWNAGVNEIANCLEDDLASVWYTDAQMMLAREHFRLHKVEKDFCEECPRRGMGSYYLLCKE